jgi:hypothetical protein
MTAIGLAASLHNGCVLANDDTALRRQRSHWPADDAPNPRRRAHRGRDHATSGQVPRHHPGLHVVEADATTPERVRRAIEKTHAVVSVLGASFSRHPSTCTRPPVACRRRHARSEELAAELSGQRRASVGAGVGAGPGVRAGWVVWARMRSRMSYKMSCAAITLARASFLTVKPATRTLLMSQRGTLTVSV